MKRYQGRKPKPKVSQWCATKTYPYEAIERRAGRWVIRRVRIAGHRLCQGERWHTRDHLECCGTPDERESYACECPCHPVRPPGFGGRG